MEDMEEPYFDEFDEPVQYTQEMKMESDITELWENVMWPYLERTDCSLLNKLDKKSGLIEFMNFMKTENDICKQIIN